MKSNNIKKQTNIPKKRAWNWGKRKPQKDDLGIEWCSCIEPKLTSPFHGRGQASCLLCMSAWYH